LKPSNILFTPKKRVVLTDFGIARFMDVPGFTLTNAIIGTPAYMSPEQAQGEGVDERSDIYSLGVILYEMVTGQVPFQDDSPVAVILKLVSGSWPLPTAINPNLPPPVEEVILKAMSQNPANRYATANELLQALRQAVEGEPGQMVVRQAGAVELKQAGPANPLQKVEVPEIAVPLPPLENETAVPQNPLGHKGTTITISGNSGQIALGGQHTLQLGDIYGGQITVGSGPLQPQKPVDPATLDLAPLYSHLAQLKSQIEAEDSPTKQAALERLAELTEALTATPPDLDTMVYTNRWFAKNSPHLTSAVTEMVRHPLVNTLVTVGGPNLVAEYRRRFSE